MATTTDLEQTGRDANILNNYLDGAPPLLDESEYGRLGKLILRLIEEGGTGSTIKYGGRVDAVEDLPETGEQNQFYFVGLETASNWDEYIWAIPTEGEAGHWDRLGSVSIIIDDQLDANSTNPVQNGIITAAITAINTAITAINTALRGKADKSEVPDISHKLTQTAIAAEYDSTHTYVDGEYFTFEGELYRVDSVNGEYIRGGDLFTAESFDVNNGFLSAESVKADGSTYGRWSARTIGYTPVTAGKVYVFDYKRVGSMAATCGIVFYNSSKSRVSGINVDRSTVKNQFTAPAGAVYARFGCGYESVDQTPRAELYEVYTSMPKVFKVTIDDMFPPEVTVDSNGDVYVGSQLIIKYLTQAEYDLIETPDPLVMYNIIPEIPVSSLNAAPQLQSLMSEPTVLTVETPEDGEDE